MAEDPQQETINVLTYRINSLTSELTAARAEIERLDTAGIHSCHNDCQRPNCVLRRELKAVTEQRDDLLRYNEEFRKETLICADCDSISKEEYDRAIEQRDRLAEVVNYWRKGRHSGEYGVALRRCIKDVDEALQSLTTNAKTIYGEKGSTP